LIRIFDTETGTRLQEVRRGTDQAEVFCISFDPVSKYIACSSDKGTIHIFAIRSDIQIAATQI
jgi:WD40 repeat protein